MSITNETKTTEAGLRTSFPIAMLMSAFLAIAFYGVIELTLLIFLTFRRWRGLYFWSLVVATWGIAVNGVGYILKFFEVTTANYFSATLIIIGWICMVTGQSVVLYSRLHLVLYDYSKVRGVLILIIANVFICHIPVAVLVYGVNSSHPAPFVRPYEVYECVQLTIFALQEVFISGLYIYYTTKMLGPVYEANGKTRKSVKTHLIYINAILIVLDVILVSLQYAGLYEIQTCLKPAVYSIKLKLEFNILNQLLQLSKSQSQGSRTRSGCYGSTTLYSHKSIIDPTNNNENDIPSFTSFIHGNGISLVGIQGQSVMRTTEIIIEREEYPSRDNASQETDHQGTGIVNKSLEKVSPSSSQTQLAQAGF
ncbi:hypothetical protein P153DRAFT_367913 [Dothidotthia symphoricarpi CBS 119687]|uniref:DUF7703 domain-containing protein n=1 Tax=Dothidotthia symphoricarpi CBS 119687 TaxID=1392245 RepID=A0A6A6A7P5_9PLEO|nr:uncharacterized protein P153DRAFT_367913 [Dothidotthia symphoricarpi CBS 119687]KAF2128002.1 hypothetical protein P153DRAFT_367913 [Dothidotthia symphoricarpi CBS 119687]